MSANSQTTCWKAIKSNFVKKTKEIGVGLVRKSSRESILLGVATPID